MRAAMLPDRTEVRNVGSAVAVVKHRSRPSLPVRLRVSGHPGTHREPKGPTRTTRPARSGPGCSARGYRRLVTSDRIRITPTVSIAAHELLWRTTRSGGPGGQHANTSETRVEVTFDVRRSPSLTPPQRALVIARIGPIVRAVAADTRSQTRNRELAQTRLVSRLAAALRSVRVRHSTAMTRASKERRLRAKQRRGATKELRRRPLRADDD